MEPCRSSAKSKRRSTENNEGVHDCNDNARSDAAQPLLVDEDASESILLTEPINELCHSGSSFEAAIKAADASSSVIDDDRVASSFSDTTTPMNNCSASTTAQNGGTTKSSKWRYPFSSGRRQIIDAMDILGMETVNGLKGAKLPSTSAVLDGAKTNFTNSQKEDSSSQIHSREPITSIAILDNGLFVTASKSHKYIKLWKIREEEVVSPTQGKDDSEAQQDAEENNNIDERNEIIEFICEFKAHVSGLTTMVKLDTRGRFLTASLDKTVKLLEIDCTKDNDDVNDGPNVLATFTNLDEQWIKVSNATFKFVISPCVLARGETLTITQSYHTSALYLLTKDHLSDQLTISIFQWSRQ